jgi:hypothetical protein
MTPFMTRVAELVGADTDPDELPTPEMIPARSWDVGTGTDRQIAIRSLAEQLVCEANAVLVEAGDHLSLDDEVGGEELAFSIRYRGRAARVSTSYLGHRAYGQIIGDGLDTHEPRELAGPEALPDLIMLLIVESGVTHAPRHV